MEEEIGELPGLATFGRENPSSSKANPKRRSEGGEPGGKNKRPKKIKEKNVLPRPISGGASERSVSAHQHKGQEHGQKLETLQILKGETKKADLYQAKRYVATLEKKALDSEAVTLEAKLRVANAALMLTPLEIHKIPLEQLKEGKSGFGLVVVD